MGWARGGRLRNLEHLEFRMGALVLVLFFGQLLLRGTTVLSLSIPSPVRVSLWCGCALGVLCLAIVNLRVRGMYFVAAGLLLNVVVVVLNAGMPLSQSAASRLGATPSQVSRSLEAGFYRLASPGTRLRVLGDVIPVPGFPGLRSVVSFGDLLMIVGVVVIVVEGMVSRPNPSRASRDER